jgi:hypothetical protein
MRQGGSAAKRASSLPRKKFASAINEPPAESTACATEKISAYVAVPSRCDHSTSPTPSVSYSDSFSTSFSITASESRSPSARASVVLPAPGHAGDDDEHV